MGIFARLKQLKQSEEILEKRSAETERLERVKSNLASDVERYRKEADAAKAKYEEKLSEELLRCQKILEEIQADYNAKISERAEELKQMEAAVDRQERALKTAKNKIAKSKDDYQRMLYALESFEPDATLLDTIEDLAPTVHLKLHSEDIKTLRKMMRENSKKIDELQTSYEGRYTTKTNATIYQLMTIALRSELQNILYAMRYDKLEHAIEQVKTITSKYLLVAQNGNQSIAGTLKKFIGEAEYLFIHAVEIEYEYYLQQQRMKEEQKALREQMRIEREEQKALEEQQKRLAAEEVKYRAEIESLHEKMAAANEEQRTELEKRERELSQQLANLDEQKEEIARLQHGKAGFVYIISNLGSFGDHMFKIGMTRRSEPMDRIDELGDASVPFKFDVHSMIFSEDAVSLENSLHETLHDRRVNKVNLRKEFFDISIEELEELVYRVQPTAEFTRTMLAEQYRQSLSMGGESLSAFIDSLDDYDELDEEE